jgi:hypothetical protein
MCSQEMRSKNEMIEHLITMDDRLLKAIACQSSLLSIPHSALDMMRLFQTTLFTRFHTCHDTFTIQIRTSVIEFLVVKSDE